MIIVLDSRRPSSLGVDVNLRLEAFLENSKHLISRCCSLGRLQLVADPPTGLIVPTSKTGKRVQVVCRGRPCTPADVSPSRLVDVQENAYGDGFSWKFLTDATLTATRIRGHAREEIVIITTDLMLAGQDSENEARFFSETSGNNASSGGPQQQHQANPVPRITMVFVEVVGSPRTGGGGASDPLTAWSELQRLRDGGGHGAAYALDLIENTTAMFDSQLRCWLRDSSARQACSLRLPATETFSGVVIEVEISHYLLNQGRLFANGGPAAAALHKGFSSMQVVQGVRLDKLDQGLCHGDPLLCTPSQLRGSPQHAQANRRLFMAVCAELNERDMGLLLALRHPSISLEERWLLLPQSPPPESAALGPPRAPRDEGVGDGVGEVLVDRALLVRLATKEDVLEDEEPMAATAMARGGLLDVAAAAVSEVSVERAAASASLDMLEKGGYNPLQHSSGLFEWLASPQQQRQAGRAGSSGSSSGGGGNSNGNGSNPTAVPRTARMVASSRGSHPHPASASASATANVIGGRQDGHRDTTGRPGVVLGSRATTGMPRRATIGGAGEMHGARRPRGRAQEQEAERWAEEARPQEQLRPRQQQPVPKTREVTLRYSEPAPQQQQQQQRGRGRSPPRGARGSSGGAGGGGGAKSKATSTGRPNKRNGALQDERGKAKAGGRDRGGGSRRRSGGSASSAGGSGGGGGVVVDDDMML